MARKLTEQERNNIDILVDMLHDALPANQRYLCAGIASALVRVPSAVIAHEDVEHILSKYGDDALELASAVEGAVLDPVEDAEGTFTLKVATEEDGQNVAQSEGEQNEERPEDGHRRQEGAPSAKAVAFGGSDSKVDPASGAKGEAGAVSDEPRSVATLAKAEPARGKTLAKVDVQADKPPTGAGGEDAVPTETPYEGDQNEGHTEAPEAAADAAEAPIRKGNRTGSRPRRHRSTSAKVMSANPESGSAEREDASMHADEVSVAEKDEPRSRTDNPTGDGETSTNASARRRRSRRTNKGDGKEPGSARTAKPHHGEQKAASDEGQPITKGDGDTKADADAKNGSHAKASSHTRESSHKTRANGDEGAKAPKDGNKKGASEGAKATGSAGDQKPVRDQSRDLKKVPYIRRGGEEEASVRQKIVSLDQRFWMNGWLLSHPGAYTLYERELTAISDLLKEGMLPGDITRRQLAYQIGGDEKFFEYGSDGFKLLRAMGMEDLVRHRPMPKPDLLYHAPRRRKHMRVLVTENLDPWLDVRNLMYEDGRSSILGERIHAVVMGGGMPVLEQNRLSILLDSLGADTITVLYWGDIDRAGIDIMLRLKELLGDSYKFRAFMPAYQLMVQKAMARYPDPLDNEVTGQVNIESPDISIICKGLSEAEVAYVQAVIDNCGLIPQEILTRRDL